jgi:hypothetical protein
MLNKNSKNSEIIAQYGKSLDDGKTRIFAMTPSSNPAYTTVFLCQQAKNGGSTTGAQSFFLGWDNTRLVRVIHNAAAEKVASLKVGMVVPFDILIEEKTEAAYDGQTQKINPSTSEAILFEGKAIYEHGSLVETGKGGVKKLERVSEAVSALGQPSAKELARS